MPIPKATSLDLEAWGNLLPPERANDYEFNLLLRKFKSFVNEVREYQELHSSCAVGNQSNQLITRKSLDHHLGSIALTSSHSNDNSVDNGNSSSGFTKNSGQSIFNLKRQLFQNQNTTSLTGGQSKERLLTKQHTVHDIQSQNLHNSTNRYQQQSIAVPHYVSSQNLTSNLGQSSSNNSFGPEIKHRAGVDSKQSFLMSKSSERLDSINNNHFHIASSLEERDIEKSLNNSNRPASHDNRFNDDNIYDAVSPDDLDDYKSSMIAAGRMDSSFLQNQQKNRPEIIKNLSAACAGKNSLDDTQLNENNPQHHAPSINKGAPINSIDKEPSNNSYNSSNLLETSHNTSSSLSLNPSYNNQDYGNYVNIDFFLKRSHSPSFDGLDEDSSENSEDEQDTKMSFSSDQLCSDALGDLSHRDFAKKLAGQRRLDSSTSITPASSGDFLDDQRCYSSRQQVASLSASSPGSQFETSKYSSFSPISRRDQDNANEHSAKSSTTPKESSISKINQQLEMIHEDQNVTFSYQQGSSSESSQLQSDTSAMAEARTSMRSFLSDLNLSPGDDVFEDKAQRRIVKESFAVELCGRRKLRHLFLFNDVIVCAKYQASSKQKFTFDVKWYLNLIGVSVSDSIEPISNSEKSNRENIDNEILAIRTNLMLLRGRMQQLKRSKDRKPSKIIKKLKKKRTQLEADLVLLLPHLPLVIKHVNGKKYTFFLSSNFDRNQWIESIKFLQSQLPTKSAVSTPSSSELQAWIQTCRKNLNPSLGTFLLRSNCDDDLLYGDLFVNTDSLKGVPKSGNFHFCFEVDSYGHFSQKSSSPILKITSSDQDLNDEYMFPLDGAHTLRVLLYEDMGQYSKPSVVGKALVELSRAWFLDKPMEKTIEFSPTCRLVARLSFTNSELLSMRVSHTKLCPTFGLDITQVCKKEKTNVPLLIQLCVNEVERRGMREVGIYRMSGTSTDIQRLKKAFETDPYVAEVLLRDIDINSVTGFLKQYLREMPEGLFINKLYPKFVAAFNMPQSELLERAKRMIELLHQIPIANQHTIVYLVEHLVKVNQFEAHNKMSLTNLATVLGPNILRPPTDSANPTNSDPFTAVVIGSMSQTYILYFFLCRKAANLPLLELDPSELTAGTQNN